MKFLICRFIIESQNMLHNIPVVRVLTSFYTQNVSYENFNFREL